MEPPVPRRADDDEPPDVVENNAAAADDDGEKEEDEIALDVVESAMRRGNDRNMVPVTLLRAVVLLEWWLSIEYEYR